MAGFFYMDAGCLCFEVSKKLGCLHIHVKSYRGGIWGFHNFGEELICKCLKKIDIALV